VKWIVDVRFPEDSVDDFFIFLHVWTVPEYVILSDTKGFPRWVKDYRALSEMLRYINDLVSQYLIPLLLVLVQFQLLFSL
jgi:hypothetical protein